MSFSFRFPFRFQLGEPDARLVSICELDAGLFESGLDRESPLFAMASRRWG